MASPSSSTKKAAKLAQSGQGRRIRFQGGTLFPMIVAIVVVVGLALVVYSRQSRPAADASSPQVDDHWHHAYGFFLCDEWFLLEGDLEERDSSGFLNEGFARTGIHSHGDGVIHWHAFSSAAVGQRATLGVFLDNYEVQLDNDRIEFPEQQRAGLPSQNDTGVFEEGETKCVIDGEEEDAVLSVVVWDNFSDTDDGTTFITDFNNIRLNQDGMVISIVFAPEGTDVTMPPWAPDLPELGAIDTVQLTPEDLVDPSVPLTEETLNTDPLSTDTVVVDSSSETDSDDTSTDDTSTDEPTTVTTLADDDGG
ncbi:MAG: hypothetical protein AAFY28_19330 [Actinomycetota bacterium]